MLIVVEGIDRSGKDTQVDLICKKLGCDSMNFPNRNNNIGHIIDDYLNNKSQIPKEVITLLFCSNRYEFKDVINNKLNNENHFVLNRYSYSGAVYSDKELDWVLNIDKYMPQPDLVIYLDINPIDASSRDDYGFEKYENLDYQKKIYEKYEKFDFFFRVDATKSVEEINNVIMDKINSLL